MLWLSKLLWEFKYHASTEIRKYIIVNYFYKGQISKNIAVHVVFYPYHIAYVYSNYVITVQ
jgi:hypothetical protein